MSDAAPWHVVLSKPGSELRAVSVPQMGGAVLLDAPREYADGRLEWDEYRLTSVGRAGSVDARHATAIYVRTVHQEQP